MDRDVLVVGGGPAGLATAIAAQLAGLRTTVLDRRRPPLDKPCGEGLMPDGLAQLRALGVQLAPGESHPFRGIRYLDGDVAAEGRFPEGCPGAGIRRTRLHAALVARAAEVGVELRWETRVEGLLDTGLRTTGGDLHAGFVVGADGLRSQVRRWCGLEGRRRGTERCGVRRHFAVAPWTDCVEVYWADGCEAYVTPVAAGEVGVAMLWSGKKAGFDELMKLFPALANRLHGAAATSRDRGTGPLRQRVRTVSQGRVALVGDASGYVDAITGEGLSLAFRQAPVLAEAMRRGDLGLYRRHHPGLGRWANALTELLLQVEARPALRRRMIRALARDPALFSRILAVHGGMHPVSSVAASTPRLLWGLVRAW